MTIAARRPFKTSVALRIWRVRRFRGGKLNGAHGQSPSANNETQFARKPQISLAFITQESNGRDVLKGAHARYPPMS
jgi:hypothetical protein